MIDIAKMRLYMTQIGLATLTLALTIWAADLITGSIASRAVVVGAIASTAFILFISPHSNTARHRHVIGGHLVSIAIALPFALFANSVSGVAFSFYIAIAVGLSMLAMAAINTEHPPAAGTAFAIVAHGVSFSLVFFVLIAIGSLVAVHSIFRRWMKDLY